MMLQRDDTNCLNHLLFGALLLSLYLVSRLSIYSFSVLYPQRVYVQKRQLSTLVICPLPHLAHRGTNGAAINLLARQRHAELLLLLLGVLITITRLRDPSFLRNKDRDFCFSKRKRKEEITTARLYRENESVAAIIHQEGRIGREKIFLVMI